MKRFRIWRFPWFDNAGPLRTMVFAVYSLWFERGDRCVIQIGFTCRFHGVVR